LATALAEAYPERVERVIYVASYALPSGHRVVDHFARDVRAFIRPFVRVSRLGGWAALAAAVRPISRRGKGECPAVAPHARPPVSV
ncbi:MAG TPA: hypothetical protein PKC26_14870, partial [Plasticicumulans sp.]|nr:hypothetical protein [Plasticicumulans sp.]